MFFSWHPKRLNKESYHQELNLVDNSVLDTTHAYGGLNQDFDGDRFGGSYLEQNCLRGQSRLQHPITFALNYLKHCSRARTICFWFHKSSRDKEYIFLKKQVLVPHKQLWWNGKKLFLVYLFIQFVPFFNQKELHDVCVHFLVYCLLNLHLLLHSMLRVGY